MNLDPASSASTGSAIPPSSIRRERGSIASQACETCRTRKQKCDEQRPKCGLCTRINSPCNYREPQPTKKDKTLVEILDKLRNLETKIDRIPTSRAPLASGFGPPQPSPSSQPSFDDQTPYSAASLRPSDPSPGGTSKSQPYRHASAAHKVLTWPAIQQMLLQSLPSNVVDWKTLEQDGSAFIVRMQKSSQVLPLDEGMNSMPFLGMQTQATRASGGARVTFPTLSKDRMNRLATAYFDSFNFLYPFMDRQNFLSDTLSKVYSEGFDGDVDSVLALLILALGEVALEGSRGNSIEVHNGRPSGVRGGTQQRPPGLAFFNEARKRLGFCLVDCELENAQVYSLAALYYQSCCRHADFWRMTVSASMTIKVLITCNTIDWGSSRGDLIKRNYWHCTIMETSLRNELDLPLTGLGSIESHVGLPAFTAPFCEADHRGNQSSHFEAHYASQLALRRLCADLHNNIYDSPPSSDTPTSSVEEPNGPTAANLLQLASSLVQWRALLPKNLQWTEENSAGFLTSNPISSAVGYGQQLDPNLSSQQTQSGMTMFSTDLNSEPVQYPYVYDIQVSLLRTRYYYAKFMVYRPFVYKALHYPEQMTTEDAQGVAECLRCCLKWPILMSPPSRCKRLIPFIFCWSQTFMSILVIFFMTQHNQMLRDIRSQFCGARFEAEVDQSIDLMLDWIRDLKSTDPIANWCYKILRPIYNLEP